ncbi:MAG TPA: hypothetical protein VFZ40_17230 [Pyrinomonadaceae bacterium]
MPTPVDIGPGYIQFYDNALPPIEADTYTISVGHTVKDDAGNQVAAYSPPNKQTFIVDGPRFTLQSTDVHAEYPPANHSGDFEQSLPHIVLSRRTLPWERLLEGSKDTPQAPWVALLLFDESDDGFAVNKWKAKPLTVTDLLTPPSGVRGPTLKNVPEFQKATNCLAIDVPLSTFRAVAPARNELAYLAHARQVNTGDKEILGVDDDGWFSVVFGNRMPNVTGSNTVHLVSLEGLTDLLPDPSNPVAPQSGDPTTVRLVSLASWSFSCDESAGSFRKLIENVTAGAGLLELPSDLPSDTTTTEEQFVNAALKQGYVPLNHTTREGEQTVAWYRGPLTPVHVQRSLSQNPYLTSDEAMVYDPVSGLFDQSYAVAWQIGRLLALSDGTFATALMNWRQEGHRLVDLVNERLILFSDYYETLNLPDTVSQLAGQKVVSRSLAQFLTTSLGPKAAPAQLSAAPLIKVADPTGLARHAGNLPGLLSEAEVATLLADGRDPIASLKDFLLARNKKNGGSNDEGGNG